MIRHLFEKMNKGIELYRNLNSIAKFFDEKFNSLRPALEAFNLEFTVFKNQLQAIQEKFENVDREFNIVKSQLMALQLQIEQMRQEWANTKEEQSRLGISILRRTELLQNRIPCDSVGSQPACANSHETLTIEQCYEKLNDLMPDTFKIWRQLVDTNQEAYEGLPVHSCSVAGHAVAEYFRLFLKPYLRGRVLDIGCGPQAVPAYLKGYPFDLISGIDPIDSCEKKPFECVKGVAEFLPWPDNSFEVVIAATSLDHVFYLERVYEEIRRVLSTHGHFLVWVSFVKGAMPYNPFAKDIQPVDKFHLFHFDKGWFEEGIEKLFEVHERMCINVEIDHYFYSLLPKQVGNCDMVSACNNSRPGLITNAE